jgi:hypothetical protein
MDFFEAQDSARSAHRLLSRSSRRAVTPSSWWSTWSSSRWASGPRSCRSIRGSPAPRHVGSSWGGRGYVAVSGAAVRLPDRAAAAGGAGGRDCSAGAGSRPTRPTRTSGGSSTWSRRWRSPRDARCRPCTSWTARTGINAFAAGHTIHDAAVAVTRGGLETAHRDELQGVIAHEFSHILNGDMRLNVRLMGVLFGILAPGGRGARHPGYMRGRSAAGGRDGGGGIVLIGARAPHPWDTSASSSAS